MKRRNIPNINIKRLKIFADLYPCLLELSADKKKISLYDSDINLNSDTLFLKLPVTVQRFDYSMIHCFDSACCEEIIQFLSKHGFTITEDLEFWINENNMKKKNIAPNSSFDK